MSTVAISALTSATAGNLTGAAILPVTDDTTTTVGMTLAQLRTSLFNSANVGYVSEIYSFPSQVGIGTAGIASQALRIGGVVITAASGAAVVASFFSRMAAFANGDVLEVVLASPQFNPGAFTGLVAKGISVAAFSTAAFTSPADPVAIDIGIVTGTGATNAFGIRIAAPTGATNNYLIADSAQTAFTVLAAGQMGLGAAAIGAYGLSITTTVTASALSGGAAIGLFGQAVLVAHANNDALRAMQLSAVFTPGAFTGLTAVGLNVGSFSVAGFASPGNPMGVNIGTITGTGAAIATALMLAPPTGATTNYLISHTTPATFNVTAAGNITGQALTATTGTFSGAFGCNAQTAQTAYASGGAVVTTTPTNVTPYGYTLAQATAILTLLNNIRAALVADGIMS